jgi:iron complex transport system substrate-binding protein
MKRKEKGITILGLSVLLCLVFLVALPATTIAAGQDDYVLGIYGNANEDDTIDMRDLTYVKLIFFGKKPETGLADAKYDGKINPLDFIQIKLIIVGKEKELTIIDGNERTVTLNMPVERIIPFADDHADAIRVLGAVDRVVGVGTEMKDKPLLYPVMSKLPDVGGVWGAGPDIEAILNLNPDVILTYEFRPSSEVLEDKLKETDIKVIRGTFNKPKGIANSFKIMGYILDKKYEAREYIDYYDSYMDLIKERTEGLSEDEKPRVYIEWCQPYLAFNKLSQVGQVCDMAGGINIAADLTGVGSPHSLVIDPEWVIEQNPDVIIKIPSRNTGYDVDDITGIKSERNKILNRPGWKNIKAAKSGNVYMLTIELHDGPQIIAAAQYYAKWFHPDLFEDQDPQAIHQKYLDKFHKDMNFNVYEQGIFVYHPELYPDGR